MKKGFTLIEILMVILIMGISASVISMTLPSDGSLAGTASEQADRLILIMEEISDRASMEGRIIGLHVEAGGYRFLYQTPNPQKKFDGMSVEQLMFLTRWEQLGWTPYQVDGVATEMTFDEGAVDPEVLAAFGYSMTLVFSSSKGGDNFEGAIGSTLYVDEVEVTYNISKAAR